MTESIRARQLTFAAAACLAAILPSCSKATTAEPRVSTVPNQTASGGVEFTLNLSNYATAPAGQVLTFSVVSGGGTITDSTYSNIFSRVGSHLVTVRATATSASTDLEFLVTVLTAQEAVLQAGSGLVLMDRGTVHNVTDDLAAGQFYAPPFIPISNSQGFTDTFKAAAKRGHVVYERAFGSPSTPTDLYVFNPNSPSTVQLGAEDPANQNFERFQARAGDNRIVFTSGPSDDPNLFIYNIDTELTREISAQIGVPEHNARVDENAIVYFERGASGARDIFAYDPATDTLVTVSVDAANEILVGTVTGGGVVFTRDNGAGDIDLWFYRSTVGLVQVAADVATTGFQDGTLAFKASTPNGMVVFEHTVSPTDTDLYYWDPTTLITTVVAATPSQLDEFNGVTSSNKIIYTAKVSVTDWDVHAREVGGVDVDYSQSANLDVFQAITALNDVVIIRDTNFIGVWDDSASAQLLFDSGAVMTFETSLANGTVLFTKAGTGLRRWVADNAVADVSATGTFAGVLGDGNFVVKITASAQDDLSIWDEATDTLSIVTADAADERFVSSTIDSSAFVFSRFSGAAKYELFVWDATDGVRSVSNTGLSHSFVASYELDNR